MHIMLEGTFGILDGQGWAYRVISTERGKERYRIAESREGRWREGDHPTMREVIEAIVALEKMLETGNGDRDEVLGIAANILALSADLPAEDTWSLRNWEVENGGPSPRGKRGCTWVHAQMSSPNKWVTLALSVAHD